MTDPIADMITRIKNALMAGRSQVSIPHSKINQALGQILVDTEYVANMTVTQKVPQPEIMIDLKYVGKVPAITDVKRMSKPGQRMYAPSNKLPRALGGYGITIISTSKGVMTDRDARKQNVGGEVLCQIW
jgi:small subunit ribosomal protein S8